MIPVLEFDDILSFAAYLGRNEISQLNNPNANARLFIVDSPCRVAKIYDGFRYETEDGGEIVLAPGTEKNIANMIEISRLLSADKYPQLALPTAIIALGGQIIGYEMPYISGMDLGAALTDSRYSHRQKINWFNQLAEIILSLPDDVFVGDLHSQNVIIRDDGIVVLIDVDGFSLETGHLLTCPAVFMEDLPQKYFDSSGALIISRETDILCLFRMFFRYLFEEYDIAVFPVEWKKRLPEYLLKRGAKPDIITAVSRLFSKDYNILCRCIFEFWADIPPAGEYNQFLKLTGLDLEESASKEAINTLIG